mmetsp:Transcript_131277/g.298918  ORF Transcript_131277/g.298918 Transcript_131277/m.298918 type:complete len:170 (-) Transcript_131277:340-849(-)|eukprot:CAMPEP_0204275302 /NCGR_PEP_ID=MMETSP0468-20130131/25722_1 /ASSEMBLY_ACC=CAM_ASM_000383 /TAXON_ID=2969 /ORGANISM="Oxyrrhis marina" /LENGTH=169 /DNA_ID=CAMNT_0051251623 /DNA_START=154 /DNA_END=663 /DNA_ORIENTATION=+
MSDTGGSPAPRPGWYLGTVKWFNPDKGFGFVVPDGGTGAASEDVFVHFSVVKGQGFKSLGDGEQVEYKATLGNDGRYRATECTGIGGSLVKGSERKTNLAVKGGKGKGKGKGAGGYPFGGVPPYQAYGQEYFQAMAAMAAAYQQYGMYGWGGYGHDGQGGYGQDGHGGY